MEEVDLVQLKLTWLEDLVQVEYKIGLHQVTHLQVIEEDIRNYGQKK